MNKFYFILFGFISCFFPLICYANILENDFSKKVALQAKVQQIGEQKIKVVIQGVIQPNWYIYSIHKKTHSPLQTKIEFSDDDWQVLSFSESTSSLVYDNLAKNFFHVHKDVFELVQVVRWQSPKKKNKLPSFVLLGFIFQVCNQKVCSLPQKITLHLPITKGKN